MRFGGLESQSIEDYVDTLNVNFLGSCLCTAGCPGMLERGSGAHHQPHIREWHTPGPRGGPVQRHQGRHGGHDPDDGDRVGSPGVRCNAIAPGFIDAGMSKPIYADPKVRKTRRGRAIAPLGSGDDIANAVLFLDSEAAGYINGHQLVIDGGVVNSVMAHLPRN